MILYVRDSFVYLVQKNMNKKFSQSINQSKMQTYLSDKIPPQKS